MNLDEHPDFGDEAIRRPDLILQGSAHQCVSTGTQGPEGGADGPKTAKSRTDPADNQSMALGSRSCRSNRVP
jgi:hypothetical protein